MIKINAYFTKQQVEALKALTKSTGLSQAEHMRRAVDAYLAQKTPPGRVVGDVSDLPDNLHMIDIDKITHPD